MSMNIFGTKLQQGRHYMTLWPRRPELNSMFPENRVIKATEFALKVIHALGVLSGRLQCQFGELVSGDQRQDERAGWPSSAGVSAAL